MPKTMPKTRPKSNRSPIEYTPQFGAGIFRPKEVVDDELAAVESTPGQTAATGHNDRTNERLDERAKERRRIRHSFDIWQDQLLSLVEIQTAAFARTGTKPKLGELVQEALTLYIAQHEGEIERSDKRTYDRTKAR